MVDVNKITLHPRHRTVETAYLAIDECIGKTMKASELTYGELFNILGRILCSWSRYAIKDERGISD